MSKHRASSRIKSRATPVVEPRRRASQERSRATIEAILEAAARVLASESLAGFNTNRVAEVAGISVGSLYQYFPNKAALSAALIERSQKELVRSVEEVAHRRHDSLLIHIRSLVRVGIRHQFSNAPLAAALDYEELRLPVQESLSFAYARLTRAVQSILDAHKDAVHVASSAQSAQDCLLIAKSMIENDALSRKSTKPTRNLANRVERALMGYLLYQI
jgi:AcrR family transcriptional regulator